MVWNRLIQLTGGTLTLHNMPWKMLAYEVFNGDLKIIATMDKTMVMEDRLGGYTEL